MIEEVDVCDKIGVELLNPFQLQSYYPKHSYSLLTEDPISGVRPVVDFDSEREKFPTGEVQVLRKINPINETSSSPLYRNNTV